ncbi:MAG: 2Fe-2S iron-sulfur cluster-binding protein [Candidatus Bathyarchaeia archaeon]
MKEIHLKIDGREVKGKEGDTVLDVCLANGIEVPTLCNLKCLTPVGACRLCVIEIEGEKKLNTACTYPAREGLVVRTDTEALNKYRRRMLEFLFAERNHYCMFCEKSGDCELQSLAYKFQMYNVPLDMLNPKLPIDSSHEYITIEHNRCVLCSRCIRACDEIVGLHVLDFSRRGNRTLVAAGLGEPVKGSPCIACGLCMQVCPTGAIFDKPSSYRFKRKDCQRIETICQECGLGCPIHAYVKDGNLVRVEGSNFEDFRVQLCRLGRFDAIHNGRARVLRPMVREGGALRECSMEEALRRAAEELRANGSNVICLASGKYPNEVLELFKRFALEVLGTIYLDSFDGEWSRAISRSSQGSWVELGHFVEEESEYSIGLSRAPYGSWEDAECAFNDIERADCLLSIDLPFEVQKPIHSKIRKAVRRGNARLIVVNPGGDPLGELAEVFLRPKPGSEAILVEAISRAARGIRADLEDVARECGVAPDALRSAAEILRSSKRCVIIYGVGLVKVGGSRAVSALFDIAKGKERMNGRFGILSIKPSSNSLGAWRLMVTSAEGIPIQMGKRPRIVYALMGDDDSIDAKYLSGLKPDFLIVQSAYRSPATSIADVVIPATTWLERGGQLIGPDGKRHLAKKVLEPPNGVIGEAEVIAELSRRLGKGIAIPRGEGIGVEVREGPRR